MNSFQDLTGNIFQFTASHEADPDLNIDAAESFDLSIHSLSRGWPTTGWKMPSERTSFNSQPLTRLTLLNSQQEPQGDLSIHSLSRGWPSMKTREDRCSVFQFTASHEADRVRVLKVLNDLLLSIHSLSRGWPFLYRTVLPPFFFQFTASHEADLYHRFEVTRHTTFNSQPLTRLTFLL